MPIPLPARLIEFILLGPLDDRRQLQDSPILGDVWVKFGEHPEKPVDLLISPYMQEHAGSLAALIDSELESDLKKDEDSGVASVQGLVAAELTFSQLLQYVVPKTKWWADQWRTVTVPAKSSSKKKVTRPSGRRKEKREHAVMKLIANRRELERALKYTLDAARNWQSPTPENPSLDLTPTKRFVAVAALLCWAGHLEATVEKQFKTVDEHIAYILEKANAKEVAGRLCDLLGKTSVSAGMESQPSGALVHTVCVNRSATPAVDKSVPAVKADAVHNLFKVDCGNIAWAILDSGIDGRHDAFWGSDGKSRIEASYDFKYFRKIVSLGNSRPGVCEKNAKLLRKTEGLLKRPTQAEAEEFLKRLADDARNQAPINWRLVERFVKIEPKTPPPSPHGTHVAGILGGNRKAVRVKQAAASSTTRDAREERAEDSTYQSLYEIGDGMCPDIKLYDFRVLAPELRETEFAIIAALQFVRYLNDRGSIKAIQGANLSLSIPHDVRNFACGRTPICGQCEKLVESGVVVVAAAGNHGYKNFQTLDGPYAGYAAFSITDPGNAESVITVGATHRYWPHTYGVSFFSSRGPTGDGRVKPDLVAPGERIHAPLVGNEGGEGSWGDLDGTSMAAPHVSGAAAMLMARYTELIEQPRRIKLILCESATDLGRERTFQGRGMLDVLRAFQSV